MAAFDIEPVGGSAFALAFFDLDRTNTAAATGLDRDNLAAAVQSTSGGGRGTVTITFPPRPDITLDPDDVGIAININGGAFSSDAFKVKATMLGLDLTYSVIDGTIGGAANFHFAPRLTGAFPSIDPLQEACAGGWVLELTIGDEVTTAEWGSWLHVYATYYGTAVTGGCVKYPIEQASPALYFDATGNPEGPDDEDPATTVTLGPNGRYDFDLVGDYTAEPIAGFDVEIDADGSGELEWHLTFDEVVGPDDVEVIGTVPVDGATTYRHRVTLADALGSSDHIPADLAELIGLMVAGIANDDGYQHAYGTLMNLPTSGGDVTVSRFRVIAFTVGCLTRRRLAPLRHRQRGDGLGASSAPRGRQNNTRQASLRGRGIY